MRKSETPHGQTMTISIVENRVTDSTCTCMAGYVYDDNLLVL